MEPAASAPLPALHGTVEQAGAAQLSTVSQMVLAMRQSVLEARLAVSGLPDRWRRVVSESLPAGWEVAELDRAVQRVKAAWAEDEASRTVKGIRSLSDGRGGVTGMQTGLDQVEEAFAALMEGRRPRDGIRPLSGPREFYLLLSGDYEMTGRFWEDRVYLANVNSTTMSNVVANVLNKMVVAEFQRYPRWWEPMVRRMTFNTLQDIKWVTLGGVGELPKVSEGAAYTELSWPDATQPATWQKRGGYLGLTLEAMDKDDVSRLQRAPQALGQAAWLTLGKSVASMFTERVGRGADPVGRRGAVRRERARQPGEHGAERGDVERGQAGDAQADGAGLGRAAGRADVARATCSCRPTWRARRCRCWRARRITRMRCRTGPRRR